jgi:[ribosomal protein S5]-alanine N-acetyltransferase
VFCSHVFFLVAVADPGSRWGADTIMIFLETERLLFRSHRPEDEGDFVAMQMDADVRRYVGGKPWPRDKAVGRFRERHVDEPTKDYGLWATVLKSENRYIRHCGLHGRTNNPKRASLACYLAQAHWGKGLATEACIAFVEVAFSQLGLAQVVADLERGNVASERLLEKLGFRFTGREEIPGRVLHHYKLACEDWNKT